MGVGDQLGKRVFGAETVRCTEERWCWEGPSELPLGKAVSTDGQLWLTHPGQGLELPSPWSALRSAVVVVELKLPGDHLDLLEWRRALLRRAAWDVAASLKSPTEGVAIEDAALVVVAPHVPEWLEERFELMLCGEGCWEVPSLQQPLFWVAANQVPLHPANLPFLVVRSGRAAFQADIWIARHINPPWLQDWIARLPMSTQALNHLHDSTYDDHHDDTQAPHDLVLEALHKAYPPVFKNLLKQTREEGHGEGRRDDLVHLFSRRLKRPLTDAERATFDARFEALGPEALGDVVLDSDADALERWLNDPKAR